MIFYYGCSRMSVDVLFSNSLSHAWNTIKNTILLHLYYDTETENIVLRHLIFRHLSEFNITCWVKLYAALCTQKREIKNNIFLEKFEPITCQEDLVKNTVNFKIELGQWILNPNQIDWFSTTVITLKHTHISRLAVRDSTDTLHCWYV